MKLLNTGVAYSLLTAALFSTIIAANAQQTPFYGLPLPGPETLQTINFKDVDFKPLPAIRPEQYPGPDGESLHSHIDALVDIALQSRELNPQRWGNFSGFPEEERVISYMRKQLASAGVTDFDSRSFDQAPFSLTTNWRAQLNGSNGDSIGLQSAVPMGVGNRNSVDSITAPLIFVGRGSAADLAGRDVSGKIAIIRGETAPHFYDFSTRNSMTRLSDAGAAGVIRLWDTPGNMQVQLGDCPSISCFNLGGEDSAFLEAVLVKAADAGELDDLSMTLEITVEREVRPAINLVGKIAGTGNSGENIILMAHTDTWFSGADDNASGLAVLIGLAEYFGDEGMQPEHDIYFLASPGHHLGAGGSAFFANTYPELIASNIVTVNLEHVASTGIARIDANMMDGILDAYGNIAPSLSPTNWDSPWHGVQMSTRTPFLVDAWQQASERSMYTQPARIWEAGRFVPGESTAMDAAGALVVQNPETPHWYHSSGSMPETVSPQSLERAYLFYSDFVNLIDQASKTEVEAR